MIADSNDVLGVIIGEEPVSRFTDSSITDNSTIGFFILAVIADERLHFENC